MSILTAGAVIAITTVMLFLLRYMFQCPHNNTTFPISIRPGDRTRRVGAASVTGTYIVCLDCGKEFPYDWEKMKVVTKENDDDSRCVAITSR